MNHAPIDPQTGPGARPHRRARSLAAGALALALGASGGCDPAETGSLDIAKSKSIAAEQGIGPGAQAPAARKVQPRTAPPPPPPR